MSIKYGIIGNLFAFIFPTKDDRNTFKTWCKFLDIKEKIPAIKNNYKNNLKKIKSYDASKKIKIVFLVNEIAKWKMQSLYDLLAQSVFYEPLILVTLADYQWELTKEKQKDTLQNTYNYFKNQGFKCEIAYDLEKMNPLALNRYNPDAVFYQQPWKLAQNQKPTEVSKYALTFYIPYYVQNYGNVDLECRQELHKTIYKYYILNEDWENIYSPEFTNAAGSIKATGHTGLDYIYLNKNIENENNYVIYAPHHSINNVENLSTFVELGMDILTYAKEHTEFNWVFKPHPTLKFQLLKNKIMTQAEIDTYYKEWENFATCCYDADYTKYFLNSKLLITDCASFLIEYFCTGKPIIHLISSRTNIKPYKPTQKIFDTFYKAHNKNELMKHLNNILIKNTDNLIEIRKEVLKQSGLLNCYAAKNILKDLDREFNKGEYNARY